MKAHYNFRLLTLDLDIYIGKASNLLVHMLSMDIYFEIKGLQRFISFYIFNLTP